jgi:hypothetical protein
VAKCGLFALVVPFFLFLFFLVLMRVLEHGAAATADRIGNVCTIYPPQPPALGASRSGVSLVLPEQPAFLLFFKN